MRKLVNKYRKPVNTYEKPENKHGTLDAKCWKPVNNGWEAQKTYGNQGPKM